MGEVGLVQDPKKHQKLLTVFFSYLIGGAPKISQSYPLMMEGYGSQSTISPEHGQSFH
jgi:hypothetical protein